MRVAVTYDVETGEIFQHFGHTEAFKIYDIEGGAIVNQMVVTTGGQGHEALANFLTRGKVEALICGGIGAGAQLALSDAGIRLFPGVEGSADDAANSFASGNIVQNTCAGCSHHADGHSCGASCGTGGCH